MKIAALIVVAVSLALGAAAAEAQSAKDIDEAKQHFAAAEAHKTAGEYDDAANEYLEAYALFPNAEFYFNVGQAYRLGGRNELALEYFGKYLELDPDGRGAVEARETVAEIERDLAAREHDKDKDKGKDKGKDPSPARSSKGKGMRVAGLVTVGVGLLSLGLGVKFGLDAGSIASELEGVTDTWTQERLDRFDDGEAAARNMILFTGIGAAAIVAGGVMYMLGRSAGKSAAVDSGISVAPTFTPSTTGLAVMGSF